MTRNEKMLNDFEKKAFISQWGKWFKDKYITGKIERVKQCEEMHGSNILEAVYYVEMGYCVYRLSYPINEKEKATAHGLMGELGTKHFEF